jgi:hypothetical protein
MDPRESATSDKTRLGVSRYSKIEGEVIFLRAITDLLDQMLNYSVFALLGNPPQGEISFHTELHQRFFNILLVDLLSDSDKQLVACKVSYLDALGNICEAPCFGDKVQQSLRASYRILIDWLAVAPSIPVWLPSLDSEVQLTLPRRTFIRICGNITKHSILRQSRPAKELKDMLEQAGSAVSLDEAALALEAFYVRFHDDILSYHASTIAAMLNDIQWGLYEYLLPEYQRSVVWEGGSPPKYHFVYPVGLDADFPKALYGDLMNDIRRKPIVRRFKVSEHLQMRY